MFTYMYWFHVVLTCALSMIPTEQSVTQSCHVISHTTLHTASVTFPTHKQVQ